MSLCVSVINWIDDVAALHIIERLGLEHETAEIFDAQIDWAASKINKAREVAIDEDRVESIALAMRAGCPIPSIVVCKRGSSYVIAGGNHRGNAARTVDRTSPWVVHIVQATGADFDVLCKALNVVVGAGSTRSERLRHAADAVNRHGVSVVDASRIFALPQETLRKSLRAEEVKRKATSLVPAASSLTQTHFERLYQMSKQTPVLQAAIEAQLANKWTAAELGEHVQIANSKDTEQLAVEYFSGLKKTGVVSSKRPVPRNKFKAFSVGLGALESVFAKHSPKSLSDIEVTPEEEAAICARVKSVVKLLTAICGR